VRRRSRTAAAAVIPAEVMATVKVTTSTTWVMVVKSRVNRSSDQFTSVVVRGYWSGVRPVVKQVAERYLREPVMRSRQLEQGLRLLTAAQQAAKDLEDRTAPSSQDLSALLAANRRVDPMTVALLRLDDARLRQIEAIQKLAASERRREELEAMVSVLEQRITVIESERDQARQETRAELQRELQMSLEYRRQADEKLAHARRAEQRARQLRLAAEKQVAVERAALMRLDRDTAADTLAPPIPTDSAIDGLQLPPLHHIRDLLDAAQEQLDAQDHELDDLGEQLGAEPGKDGDDESVVTQIVWGQVVDSAGHQAADVPPHALDNPRKPPDRPRRAGHAQRDRTGGATQSRHGRPTCCVHQAGGEPERSGHCGRVVVVAVPTAAPHRHAVDRRTQRRATRSDEGRRAPRRRRPLDRRRRRTRHLDPT
jgi:hypothetical protein